MNDVTMIRENLGLTVAELANALGVGAATVRRWERGMAPAGTAAIVLVALQAVISDTYRTIKPRSDAVHELLRIGLIVKLGIGALIFYGLTTISLMGGHDDVVKVAPKALGGKA